jgi:IPT/TIG domain
MSESAGESREGSEEPVAEEKKPSAEEPAAVMKEAVEEAPEKTPAPPVEEPPAETPAPPVEEPPAETPAAVIQEAVEEPPAETPAAVIEQAVEEPAPPPPSPPSITGVEPDHGPVTGGTTLRVLGAAFAEGCKVLLGSVEATTARETEACLRVETPARQTKGLVELRVVNPDGQIALYDDDFRYDAAPSITGTEPPCVSTEGGAVLTILGAELAKACSVRIGGVLVPSSWMHAGRLEVVVKAHEAGEVDLEVKNPDGQIAVRPRAVRFAAPPAIAEVAPATTFTRGGAEVRLAGRGFEPGCAVLVAGAPVPAVTFVSDTELRFAAPPHRAVEAVDVAVVNPTGLTHRRPRALAYAESPPHVTFIAPNWGPSAGGTEVAVTGHDFDEGAAVFVCGIAAKVSFRSRDELAVVTPLVARDGLVEVRVVNPDGQAHVVEKAFRYVAPQPPPVLREVSPRQGSQLGGLAVALLGEDFAEGVTVRFGGVAAEVRFLTGKELAATTPAFSGFGDVAVEVTHPDGASSLLADAFTYEARPAPEIAGITPTSGPTTGGTRVLIEGKNFNRECAVFLGREPPKDLLVKSATEIHIVTASRKQAGVVDVEVSFPGAPRAVMKNGFRYDAVPAPVITSVSPSAGAVGGGTEVTVSGKNFLKDTIVLVDGKAPRTVKLVDASTLELKVPPGEPGKMVDVIVRNPDGKEAVQKRAFLYDPRYRG